MVRGKYLLCLTGGCMFARFLALFLLLIAPPALARDEAFRFASIDGGDLVMDDWRGQPGLVANTASLCAFTPQYDGLQALYDSYRDRGLVVLAVPSDDFAQELGSEEEVKEFCEINFGLDLPMTEITPVRGRGAHPFYRWLAQEHRVRPRWNFNKVLIGPEGEFIAHWGSNVPPTSDRITALIEPLLPR
ncbi:MAG: glutathione peroxidase [Alphaproteobacteria bacterium]|nr:glutathione peroxidase [Alphaproteobacteria bacterium]